MTQEEEARSGQIIQLMGFWVALVGKVTTKLNPTQKMISQLDCFKALALVLTAEVHPIGPEDGIEVRYTQQHQLLLHERPRVLRELKVHERVWLGYLSSDWFARTSDTNCRTLGKLRPALMLAGMRCANYHHLNALAPHLENPTSKKSRLPWTMQGFDDTLLPPGCGQDHPCLRFSQFLTDSWAEGSNHEYNFPDHAGLVVVTKTETISPLTHSPVPQ